MDLRVCSECGKGKPLSDFDGTNAGCQVCVDAMLAALSVEQWELLDQMLQHEREGLKVTYAPSLLQSLSRDFWKTKAYIQQAICRFER
jgi:hypothetical protein